MRRVNLSVSFADTFRATLNSGLLVLVSLVILQTQLISSASAEVTFLNKWGSQGSGDGEFDFPSSIAITHTGQVYVVDAANHRIQRFFDSEEWVSGTNMFVNSAAGPTSVAVGSGDILGSSPHSMRARDLLSVIQPRSMLAVPFRLGVAA